MCRKIQNAVERAMRSTLTPADLIAGLPNDLRHPDYAAPMLPAGTPVELDALVDHAKAVIWLFEDWGKYLHAYVAQHHHGSERHAEYEGLDGLVAYIESAAEAAYVARREARNERHHLEAAE